MLRLTFSFVWRSTATMLFLSSAVAMAQPPKTDPPKTDPPKTDTPKNPDEQKAREAFLAGKFDDAIKLLQSAAKTNPIMAPPKVVATRWALETGQNQQARAFIEQAAAEDPSHPDVLLTNASIALAEGRVTETILGCAAALAASDSPRWDEVTKKRFRREARLGLAGAFDMRSDHGSVKVHLLALLETDARNAILRQRLARANFLLNRPDDAFAELQAAVKEDPTLDPPELSMAQLWTGKQDFAKADEWFNKAVSTQPNNPKVHRAFTGYLLDRGRLDSAKAHLAAAMKIEPTARDTKALTGLVARYNRDHAGAAAVFEELVKDYPSYGFATANLALVLAESADEKGKRRASELAEGYAKQNPRSAEPRAILAYCLYKSGRTADAEKVARSALEFGPLTPDAAYFLALILSDRGANEDAQRLASAACESKDGFVHRKEAETLLAELNKKVPPEKK